MEIVKTNGKNTFNFAMQAQNNKGTQGSSTLSVKEYGDGVNHVTKITLSDFVIGALAEAAADYVLIPVTPLYTMPDGAHVLEASHANVGLSCEGTAVTPEIGLGSVVGDGSANSDLGTAGSTMEDIHEGYSVADTDTAAEVENGPVAITAGALTGIALNGSSDSKDIYLNCAGTWNADNTGNLLANGEIVLVWKTLTTD